MAVDWNRWHAALEKAFAEGKAPGLKEEAEARADIYNEDSTTRDDVEDGEEWEPMSLGEAFFSRFNVCESNASSGDPDAKKALKDYRRLLIEVGFYTEFTPSIAATVVSTGRAWAFQMGGKKWWHDEEA